jgi:hypothetical protein
MAHKLSGDWTSTTIDERGRRLPDDRFHLAIDEDSGTVDNTRSTHRGRPVRSGQAVRGDVHRIEIVNHLGMTYRGALVVDTESLQVLCGFRTQNEDQRAEERDDDAPQDYKDVESGESEGRRRRLDQEQVIWVATKP